MTKSDVYYRIIFVKKIFFLFVAFMSLAIVVPAFAAYPVKPTPPEAPPLPEISGEYTVPGRPNLILRVIPHPEKPNHTTKVTKAVCTADNDSTEVVSGAGWHLKDCTTTYRVNYASVPSTVGASAADTAFTNAFATWDNLVTDVTIVKGSSTNVKRARFDSQNAVFFGRLSSSSIGITYIWYYPSTGEVAEVDTAYNSRYRWSYTPYTVSACGTDNSFDLQNIATHEKGHWFGLDDEYDGAYFDNTMYGYGDLGELKKDTLTAGDTANLTAIYK